MRNTSPNNLRSAAVNEFPASLPKWFPFFLVGMGLVGVLGCQLLG
jgi:hypothetical protein